MTGARLASKLWLLWNIGGHPGEGRHWLERVVAAGNMIPSDLRAEVLYQAGQLAQDQGDEVRAAPLLADALALARGSGVGWLQPMALRMQGILASRQGEYDRAIPLFEEALRLFQESDDRPHVAHTLHHLGIVAYGQGDLSRARALCQEALDLAGKRHPLFTPWILNSLALIDCARGDYDRSGGRAGRRICSGAGPRGGREAIGHRRGPRGRTGLAGLDCSPARRG